ncbi:MAG: hypothetical protein LBF22_01010 [Deltaproteobacteria bacterium]|nr:hypothetical protein [Deltaproteobacteria bacterium]
MVKVPVRASQSLVPKPCNPSPVSEALYRNPVPKLCTERNLSHHKVGWREPLGKQTVRGTTNLFRLCHVVTVQK